MKYQAITWINDVYNDGSQPFAVRVLYEGEDRLNAEYLAQEFLGSARVLTDTNGWVPIAQIEG